MNRELLTEARAGLLKALGHPTRIRILELLRDGERCVCEIVPELNFDQPVISRHLAVLRKEGIVECEKEGLKVIYRVKDKNIFALLDLVDDILLKKLNESSGLLKFLSGKQENSLKHYGIKNY